jgi:RecB family exonuclease
VPVTVAWNSRELAAAIAALPVTGPLPRRTVLVPREAVAHSLRRELVRMGRPDALAGTRFVPTSIAAVEVLRVAGVEFTLGEAGLRPTRLLALFRQGLALEHFPIDLLRDRPGWDEAFARTIGDLEAGGLRPEDLAEPGQTRDIATVWRRIDEAAATSWTLARLCLEAAARLESRPELWPSRGPTLAVLTTTVNAVHARFVAAIPDVTLGLLAGRPVRAHFVRRLEILFGVNAAQHVVGSAPLRTSSTERELLASYLFEPPPLLADPARPVSSGPDGTVSLEEHAGIDEEVEAAADWVARQVDAGTALEDIAILAPVLDPFAELIVTRLGRLRWQDGTMPVHVAGGLPLPSSAAGARALALVRALRTHLAGDALAAVLPALRATSAEGDADSAAHHLSLASATDLVWSLGTAGGNAAHPEGALDWAPRAVERERALAAAFARVEERDGDDPEQAGLPRRPWEIERLLRNLRAIRPAFDALVGIARLVVDAATLSSLWPAMRAFLESWLLQPGSGPRVHALLDERLALALTDGACATLAGDDALRMIEDTIVSTRLPAGRFGEPAVYVGTVRDAVGLHFHAARLVGLAEGYLPDPPREDPVLPDSLRTSLVGLGGRPVAPATIADRALAGLHALDAVVRDTEVRVALCAPRLDLDRSQREPSSVLLEAAVALGRPNAITGARGPAIPDAVALRRDAFVPARSEARRFRRSLPVSEAAWQDGVATGDFGLPSWWRGAASLELDRIAALIRSESAGPMDGWLALGDELSVPGLAGDWPLSASTFGTLLACPHRFLLEKILHLEPPATAPALRSIEAMAYGGLVHRVVEAFLRAHGAPFANRAERIDAWLDRANQIVEQHFAAFMEEYPLIGDVVRRAERERLRADVQELLRFEWDRGDERRFVDVERAFGPLALPPPGRPLFVRGRIDRIDATRARTLVRDLKTGRAHPRRGAEASPDPVRDAQIAIYGLVARVLAPEWQTPAAVGVAYTYVNRGVRERDYVDDFDKILEPAAREWLTVAAGLLERRAFPRTPNAGDCTYCDFRPVCGDGIHERAVRLLDDGDALHTRFLVIKGHDDTEDED